MKNIFLTMLVLVIIALFSGCSKDENPVTPDAEVQIGELVINPNSLIAGTPTEVIVRLNVTAGVSLVDSSVKLVRLDANDAIVEELTLLFDDGDLDHGDEISGDNIFSAIVTIVQPEGQLRLKAVAEVQQTDQVVTGGSVVNTVSVYADFSSPELNILLNTQQEAFNKLNEYMGGNVNNLETAIGQVVTWLQAQPGVDEVSSDGTANIEIRYSSNVYGGLVFAQEDEFGSIIT
ncbi:MAG: hypothetical protein R6W68_14155, partial [Ignavibacteriaceae bacterium]